LGESKKNKNPQKIIKIHIKKSKKERIERKEKK